MCNNDNKQNIKQRKIAKTKERELNLAIFFILKLRYFSF